MADAAGGFFAFAIWSSEDQRVEVVSAVEV